MYIYSKMQMEVVNLSQQTKIVEHIDYQEMVEQDKLVEQVQHQDLGQEEVMQLHIQEEQADMQIMVVDQQAIRIQVI